MSSLNAQSLEHWAKYAYEVALQAGAKIMHHYAQSDTIRAEFKSDSTPVTVADREASLIIENMLSRFSMDKYGVAPVLSEEGAQPSFLERQAWARYWCVDPLDGTREFLARTNEFCVNIALIEGHEPVIGIIYSPYLQVGYCAWRGGGAYRVSQSKFERITTRPRQTPIRIVCSRHGSNERIRALAAKLGEIELMPSGSAMKYGRIASGEADLLFRLSPTSEWDNAAGQCIVEEAGGGLVKLDGEPLGYNHSGSLIQTNFFVYGDKTVPWLDYF